MFPFRRRLSGKRSRWTAAAVSFLLAAAHGWREDRSASAQQPSKEVAEELVLERYLARLGLAELQAAQLERLIDRELPSEQRLTLARQLADLYAEQLMNSSDKPERFAQIKARIDALTKKTPQARTAALDVMLLQADYNRAEGEIAKWIADPKQTAARDAARDTLTRITPLLDKQGKEVEATTEAMLKELDGMDDGPARQTKEAELARLQAVAGRAAYFSGWSNYYLGLLKGPTATEFASSRQIFRGLLDVGDEDPKEIKPEELGLDSVWRARAVIGWGLAEAAVGNVAASQACFNLLEHASVPPAVQDQAPYWCVQGLLNARSYAEAKAYAAERIAAFGDNATQGKVSLCAALVRAGFADKTNAAPILRELGALGIEGLARLGQQSAVRALIEKYAIDLGAASSFHLLWANGQSLLAAAEKSKQKADFQKAADALAAALAAPDAKSQLAFAGKCRGEQAWCLYKLEQFESAARLYEQAAGELAAAKDEAAPEALWMAFVCYQNLVKEQPRFAAPAIEALSSLKRDFPRHKYAERADYYIGKLKQSAASVADTVKQLEAVKPGSPSYLSARYDICLLLYQQWSEGDEKDARLAQQTTNAVDVYLKAGAKEDPSRIVKAGLIGASVMLGGESPNADKAADYLSQVETLASTLPDSSALAAEFHYRLLQIARQRGDADEARAQAQWIVEQAPGSAYEAPALILVTQAVEAALKRSPSDELREQAFELYGRLVRVLGDDPETLKSRKNAQVASAKYSEYAVALGRHEDAADTLANLVKAFPSDKAYLRRAGLSEFEAGRYDAALVHWRTLLAGLAKGSKEWHEAKYYQLACLAQTDKPTAKKVFKQLQLLYPELGPSPWREKLLELAKRL
jgi:hypothetical protein